MSIPTRSNSLRIGIGNKITIEEDDRDARLAETLGDALADDFLVGQKLEGHEEHTAHGTLDEVLANLLGLLGSQLGRRFAVGATAPEKAVVVGAGEAGEFAADGLEEIRNAEGGRARRAGAVAGAGARSPCTRYEPEPARRSMRPSTCKSRSARATVGRETPKRLTSCASLGRREVVE